MHEPGAKNGPLIVQLPESFQTPRPAGLPHLKVPTPGTAGAKATMESSTAAPVPVSHSLLIHRRHWFIGPDYRPYMTSSRVCIALQCHKDEQQEYGVTCICTILVTFSLE